MTYARIKRYGRVKFPEETDFQVVVLIRETDSK